MTADFDLHPLSSAQEKIIFALEKGNAKVKAVAGSGKTTMALYIAKYFADKKVLFLTYNRRLKIETTKKAVAENLDNITIKTFHGFACDYYGQAYDDVMLKTILEQDLNSDFLFDIIVIDEAQDITPILYELICKILSNNVVEPHICVMGDPYQLIYDFKQADARYLLHAEKLFGFNQLPWTSCTLKTSYRLSGKVCNFLNQSFFKFPKLIAANPKANKQEVSYLICDTSQIKTISSKIIDAISKYGINNVLILSVSLNSRSGLAIRILNELVQRGINIYTPEHEKANGGNDIEVLNKLLFLTFHQAKGIERKVVFVLNFDASYFEIVKAADPYKVSNPLYVALTRASEKLVILHSITKEFIPFLNHNNIENEVDLKYIGTDQQIQTFKSTIKNALFVPKKSKSNKNFQVTSLINYLPSEILYECLSYINIEAMNNSVNPIIKSQFRHIKNILKISSNWSVYNKGPILSFENVSAINGIAANIALQCHFRNESSQPESLKLLSTLFKLQGKYIAKDAPLLWSYRSFVTNLSQAPEYKYTAKDKILLALLWDCYMTKNTSKLAKIKYHDCTWFTDVDFTKMTSKLDDKISHNAKFELAVNYKGTITTNPELRNYSISGIIDCVDYDTNNLWEFKFIDSFDARHYLQLALYAYLVLHKNNAQYQNFTYNLFNLKTNEWFTITPNSRASFTKIVDLLVTNRLLKTKKLTDEQFLEESELICNRYLKLQDLDTTILIDNFEETKVHTNLVVNKPVTVFRSWKSVWKRFKKRDHKYHNSF